MARRRKKRTLKPRVPARVKKRPRKGTRKGHQHPELIGLALLALGLFLATVLYLGWSGGMVGGWFAGGFTGAIGGGFGDLFGLLLGGTGTTILGVLTLVIGALLLTGASAGALVRRSGHAVKRAHSRARRARPVEPSRPPAPVIPLRTPDPPVDAVHDFPDVVGERTSAPPPLLVHPPPDSEEPDQPSLFDVTHGTQDEYRHPDRGILSSSPPRSDVAGDAAERTAAALVQTLSHFGVEATIVGQIAGPRVTRYELQLAPGTKVSKVAALTDDLSYALATT